MRIVSILTLLMCVMAGCKAATMLFAEQRWSHNLTQDPGVRATDPALIDGDLNTIGRSTFPQEIDTSLRFPVSEVRIEFPEPRMIRKIVIYSDNLTAFEVHTRDNLGHWKKMIDVKSNKKPEIVVQLTDRTDSIRIRVIRTSDDAAQRRKNMERLPGGWTVIQGQIRAPALIREVEVYGLVETE